MMEGLPLDGDVLVADLFLGDLDVLDPLFRDVLGNVLSEVFNSVVISDSDLLGDGLDLPLLTVFHLLDLLGDTLHLGLILVFHDLLLEGHVLDPALTLDHLLASVDSSANHLGLTSGDGASLDVSATDGSTVDIVASSSDVLGVSTLSVGGILGGVGGGLGIGDGLSSLSSRSSSIGV